MRRSQINTTMSSRDFLSLQMRGKFSQNQSTRNLSGPPDLSQIEVRSKTWETSIAYLYLVGDVLLVLLPLFFILLGVAVITLHGKPTKGNNFGSKVKFAIQLGPTLFPIIFAAISGRSMKMIARYLAEKGARLSISKSFLKSGHIIGGTIESQILMQRLTVVGANLLFLWTLSPLDSQASLCLMKRDSTTFKGNGKFSDAGALFGAAVLAPQAIKIRPQDMWGNVKIPALEALDMSKVDSIGWIVVPSNISTPETYSSLVGLPVAGIQANTNSTFNLESTYLSVNCGRFNQTTNPSSFNPFTPLNRTASFFIDTDCPLFPGSVSDAGDEILMARLDGFVGNFNSSILNNMDAQWNRNLLYVSQYALTHDSNPMGLNIASCSLSQTHVEAMVDCDKDQCAVQKIRKSLTDTRPASFTGLEHHLIMSGIAENFPTAFTSPGGSSPTERFLVDTSSFPFIQETGYPTMDRRWVNVSIIPPDVFSKRLSLVLNTYYQLSTQPTGYFGSLPKNLTLYGPDTLPVSDIDAYLPGNLSATKHTFEEWWVPFREVVQDSAAPFIGATTTAKVSTAQEIFVCNFAWLALLLASSGIIFTTGAAALVLKRKTLGPELFGFYENPYIKIPQGGSMLDAMERARLLQDVEVYVADVQGDDDVGHIALAAGVPLRKLERDRLYS
ncbi:hypothetical protein K469DRAFT_731168 [Zopfia rhizophila CBS 207.26]|uniref:Uncharacterized protein n=1 Tax=Zopfia rhizophila CBS 207.26 TaxID=1314779 RepID=A0A6A6EPS3_9PEZI|nr:hypothetical protein K469DRAFT_731168 [Zopfia rhizophila CBS 207.26]